MFLSNKFLGKTFVLACVFYSREDKNKNGWGFNWSKTFEWCKAIKPIHFRIGYFVFSFGINNWE